MTVRSANETVAWCRDQSQHGRAIWHNMCLAFVHEAFNIGSMYPSAANAWENAAHKHKVRSGEDCPRGVPVFWTGGSQGYGHIVVSVGGGLCYSTDIRRYGLCDLVRIDDITRSWGQNFQGWTEDLNGVRAYEPDPPPDRFTSGPVYVAKLHLHSLDSDSVRRLQTRLLHHSDVPAKRVRVSGNYTEGTLEAVRYWQRVVTEVDGPKDGKSISNHQANRLFGKDFHVIEA